MWVVCLANTAAVPSSRKACWGWGGELGGRRQSGGWDWWYLPLLIAQSYAVIAFHSTSLGPKQLPEPPWDKRTLVPLPHVELRWPQWVCLYLCQLLRWDCDCTSTIAINWINMLHTINTNTLTMEFAILHWHSQWTWSQAVQLGWYS